jgi:membrane protease YdiL (CAAX protease family)
MLQLTSKTARILYSIIASVIIILFWRNLGFITTFLDMPGNSNLSLSIKTLFLTLVTLILVRVVIKPKELFSFLGLNRNIIKGFGIAFLCALPLYLIFPFFGDFNKELTFNELYNKCILTGFKEELVFRAFMFGLLFRYAKTGFFWAVILPAIYFGSVHLYQGHNVLSALAAFGVTFIGALYFSWMYVEWNFNLWIPAGLHILMNGAWHIFTMEGTEVAAGGLISNIARIISIALAIAFTVYYHKKKGERIFDYSIWNW